MMSDNASTPTAVLLGPQRLAPIVAYALDQLKVTGTVAVVTAGWQEREAEDAELKVALGRPIINLRLHARGDAVFRDDPELFATHRDKQDRLKHLQDIYRRRLGHHLAEVRQLQNLKQSEPLLPSDLIIPQIDSAIEQVRQLDEEHLRHARAIDAEFDADIRPTERPAVVAQRQELEALLKDASAIAIAGGHVVILLNRLRLFGMESMLASKPIVAWSAGAMVLTERIVLFHDSPPQGRGNAELLCDGLGIIPGIVALPHARRRLHLTDKHRVALLARRFAPAACVTLDERCHVSYYPGGGAGGRGSYRANENTSTLTADGHCVPMEK